MAPNVPTYTGCVRSAFWWPLGSGFRAQIVSMPESLPCGRDGVLDAHHICAFSGEDMNRPVRVKLSIELVSYLDIGHMFASGKLRIS